MKKSLLTITLAAFCSQTCPQEQSLIEKINLSRAMNAYSKHIQTKIDAIINSYYGYGYEPASQKYQDMGLEAQKAVGISPDRILPILKFSPSSKFGQKFVAIAESNAIYINEDMFDNMSYGAQRFTLLHEATHVKHHDTATKGLLKPISILSGIATYQAMNKLNIVTLRKSLSVMVCISTFFYLNSKYTKLIENRADTQAMIATNCACCIAEEVKRKTDMFEKQAAAFKAAIQSAPKEYKEVFEKYLAGRSIEEFLEESLCAQGYLYRSDLEKAAKELGDKKCAHHTAQESKK
ncbi:MAG: hypothetical protein NTU89_03585 [Candidatus Dependentiae bacterium]|nr:hypothetical protein [Candidatus Dependentiae bacterium]